MVTNFRPLTSTVTTSRLPTSMETTHSNGFAAHNSNTACYKRDSKSMVKAFKEDIINIIFIFIINFLIFFHVYPYPKAKLFLMFFCKHQKSNTTTLKEGETYREKYRDRLSRIIAFLVLYTYSACMHLLYKACTISTVAYVHLHNYGSVGISKLIQSTGSACIDLLYKSCTISIAAYVHLHYYDSIGTSKLIQSTCSACMYLFYKSCFISIFAYVHLHYYGSVRTNKAFHNFPICSAKTENKQLQNFHTRGCRKKKEEDTSSYKTNIIATTWKKKLQADTNMAPTNALPSTMWFHKNHLTHRQGNKTMALLPTTTSLVLIHYQT
jgi:hypothetical protein